jgi:hypothetical protein
MKISNAPAVKREAEEESGKREKKPCFRWCHTVPVVLVPDRPTKDDAGRALLLLRQAFWTFPFADADLIPDGTLDLSQPPRLDESTHLVAPMTSVSHPAFSTKRQTYRAPVPARGFWSGALAERAPCHDGPAMTMMS